MKNISTVLSVLALVLTGILFYLHFSSKKVTTVQSVKTEAAVSKDFSIAYFDIDSLQEHYDYYKDALADMKKREASMNGELQGLKNKFQQRYQHFQDNARTMTQVDGENAQRELARMEQAYRSKEAELQDNLRNQQMEMTKKMRKEIESYLADYNKDKGYSYIFSYEPGFIMYYKDSMYNITPDVIKGLNDLYKDKKKEAK
jgi:outer membrane protein